MLLDHYGEEGSGLLPFSCWTCMAETWKTTRVHRRNLYSGAINMLFDGGEGDNILVDMSVDFKYLVLAMTS